MIHDKNYIAFDIECYLDKNKDFVPYACGWFTKKRNKIYLSKDFNS